MITNSNKESNKPAKTWPLSEALKLRYQQGLTYQQLADRYHVTPSAIVQRFQRFNLIPTDPEDLTTYKENRSDIIAAQQIKILNSINEQDLEKAPLQSKVWSYGVLYDKERLERGLSTSNIALQQTLDIVQTRSQAPISRFNKDKVVGIISTETDNNV